ncbi:MAG: NAD(P)-dependent oxidoreductase [Gammaproteobacteria bacterium]|nr:NAD(P)-dependent oxidoreductase [Gammaproteobacteria bacterium]
MLSSNSKIGVTSRTFSRSTDLRAKLEQVFKNVIYNDEGIHFDDSSLVTFLSDCEGAIVSGENFSEDVINKLSNLKALSKFGVGIDTIDIEYLEKKGINFHWRPGINANSVAELALSYLILLLREANIHNRELLNGKWSKVINSRELSECVIGIIGFGQIGRKLAQFLEAHDSKVLVYDPHIEVSKTDRRSVEITTMDKLIKNSDAISLHIPYTNETHNLINEDRIRKMKKGSVLVNLSRGGIVNEKHLVNALKDEHLSGAAVDVFQSEPANFPELVQLKTCFSTPHIAGTSNYASSQLGLSAINGLTKNVK